MNRTFVIAEAAGCHDGDLGKALRLVDLARAIRADAVKFQWVSQAVRLCERRHAPEYLDAYRLLQFPHEWFSALVARCSARAPSSCCTDLIGTEEPSVEFMCTVFLPEDVPVIAPYVTRFKVSSFEAQDGEFIRAHLPYGKPIIGSLGAADIQTQSGRLGYALTRPGDAILHCVAAYPVPWDEINLLAIREIKNYSWTSAQPLGGLSDHTTHPWTGALAVAAGADIIEFHLRLWDTWEGNADYQVSRNPGEALDYVANIRLAEAMLGDGVKRVQPCEEPMLRYRVGG